VFSQEKNYAMLAVINACRALLSARMLCIPGYITAILEPADQCRVRLTPCCLFKTAVFKARPGR
jgi:hypothetical protein